jgi:hypothetical protein
MSRLRLAVIVAAVIAVPAGCDRLPGLPVSGNPGVHCGAFEGPDCNDLLEIGLDTISPGVAQEPLAIAVDDLCPPNARCPASALGGATAAVIVRRADGTIGWVTIPLPPDWPSSPPGDAMVMADAPPPHLLALVGGKQT